jgi:hypothetical protein
MERPPVRAEEKGYVQPQGFILGVITSVLFSLFLEIVRRAAPQPESGEQEVGDERLR